jgi:hypothetical protein
MAPKPSWIPNRPPRNRIRVKKFKSFTFAGLRNNLPQWVVLIPTGKVNEYKNPLYRVIRCDSWEDAHNRAFDLNDMINRGGGSIYPELGKSWTL